MQRSFTRSSESLKINSTIFMIYSQFFTFSAKFFRYFTAMILIEAFSLKIKELKISKKVASKWGTSLTPLTINLAPHSFDTFMLAFDNFRIIYRYSSGFFSKIGSIIDRDLKATSFSSSLQKDVKSGRMLFSYSEPPSMWVMLVSSSRTASMMLGSSSINSRCQG